MTPEQRKLFHRLCSLIADSGMKWAGRAHAAARQEDPGEIVEGLEGEVVNLVLMRESTIDMPVQRAASLIDYTLALCHTHGIRVPARAGVAA
jgi:hypothetical protein